MFDAVGTKHRRDRFSSRFRHGYARDALDDARFLHKSRIEFGGNCRLVSERLIAWHERLTTGDDLTVITWESRIRRGCRSCAPEVIAIIREEINFRFVEKGRLSSISLRENDFVEQFDGGVIRPCAFSFVNKLVESWIWLECKYHVAMVKTVP